ncbi:unnamed protein product [Lactuca virosa]|uniref:Chloroplastic group IIB intron splicing facilitator CRS2, chloroplastic n=1 Tax=Lactuca virosa TaxID=75947 RepID=A0AAU9M7A6_9ASTR|nr:unnamed protein product [Lactuca virosa]
MTVPIWIILMIIYKIPSRSVTELREIFVWIVKLCLPKSLSIHGTRTRTSFYPGIRAKYLKLVNSFVVFHIHFKILPIPASRRLERSMLYAVSIPKPCLSYPKTTFHSQNPQNLKRGVLRVSATLPESNGVKVEYTPWLIVGLGNPGNKYHGTRHNVGFEMIERISQEERIVMNTIQSKALVGIGSIGEVPVLLAKPQGYMNFSGESVGPLAAYYQVPLRHILLIYDEMSLPNGVLRLQPKGGHGYHNGVKSVMEHLDGRREFPRFCIGIGNPPGTMDMKAFLLQKFSDVEQKEIDGALAQGVDAVRSLVLNGFNDRITRFNLGQKYKYNKV